MARRVRKIRVVFSEKCRIETVRILCLPLSPRKNRFTPKSGSSRGFPENQDDPEEPIQILHGREKFFSCIARGKGLDIIMAY